MHEWIYEEKEGRYSDTRKSERKKETSPQRKNELKARKNDVKREKQKENEESKGK